MAAKKLKQSAQEQIEEAVSKIEDLLSEVSNNLTEVGNDEYERGRLSAIRELPRFIGDDWTDYIEELKRNPKMDGKTEAIEEAVGRFLKWCEKPNRMFHPKFAEENK